MKIYFSIFLLFLFWGCDTQPKEGVMGQNMASEVSNYSKSELNDLANAEGRSIDFLTKEKLESLISQKELTVFHVNDASDFEFYKTLEKVEADFEGKFKLIHVFFSKNKTLKEVNLFVRKNNLVSEAFILREKDLLSDFNKNWTGSVPSIWIKNAEEGIDLLYEQSLSEEELMTILQPVTL